MAALLFAPSVVAGTVPVRNAELDAAHACLTAGAERLLAEDRSKPTKEDRWGWALTVADGCEDKINAAAESEGSVLILGDYAPLRISKRNMLRAEANYFVDRLIREHFERLASEQAK